MWIFVIAALLAPVRAEAAPDDSPTVILQTSMGEITLQLDRKRAPTTVDNFLRYVREGHYDGTIFYRVVPGFVIQGGSYVADFSARPVHEPIALEANNGLLNLRGSIAMARLDPNSATAEFFIDLADNHNLDRGPDDKANQTGYAVFGHVVGGMDVVDKIASVPVGPTGPFPGHTPVEPVVIRKAIVQN
jgi:cyclophilin family peptidyl-prolyl cis-trans isomerase